METVMKHMQSINLKGWCLAACCAVMMLYAQAQLGELQWAVQTSSPYIKEYEAMAVDSEGNSLIVIDTANEFSFAGEHIPHIYLNSGYSRGATLIKLDPTGNVLWHRSLRGPWQSFARYVDIDIDQDDNIYVNYTGRSNFENASPIGGLYAMSTKNEDFFLIKISPEGEGIWYKVANRNTIISGGWNMCKVGTDGVYSIGPLYGSVNFDGIELVNQNASGSMYLVKLDHEGNVLWGKMLSTAFGSMDVDAMETGSDGSLYLSGGWEGEVFQIDDLSIVNDLFFTGVWDRYICKISPDGTALWLVREHSADFEMTSSLTTTPEGELLVLSYIGELPLYVGDFEVNGEGLVMSRYSSDGDVLAASLIGGFPDDFPFAQAPYISGDGQGAYYITRKFAKSSLSLGGIEVSNAGGATGTTDIFVAKMDKFGQVEWVYTLGNEESEEGLFVADVDTERLVLGGIYTGIDFNIQGTTLTAHTALNTEQFVASFSTALNTRTAEALQQLLAHPNPFSENVQFDTEALLAFGNAMLTVFNTSGVEVYRKELHGNDAGQVGLGHLPQGAYIARLSDGKRSLHAKIIKQ